MNFDFHKLLNKYYEESETKFDGADFLSVTKVDNHIHAASSMRRDEMLAFMKRKYSEEGDLVVAKEGEVDITLKEALNISKEKHLILNILLPTVWIWQLLPRCFIALITSMILTIQWEDPIFAVSL